MRTPPRIRGVAGLFVPLTAMIGTLFLASCGSNNNYANTPPPKTYAVGGNVSGLAGSGLMLQDNGGNNLAVTANGPFTFTAALNSGANYNVTVFSQPTSVSQTCTVMSGSGSISANVTNVSVMCTTDAFTVGGTVSGLVGSGLVIQDNGGNNLTLAANGAFSFTTALASGTAFGVTLLTEPTNPVQTCTVTNGSGTVTTGPITTVVVTCPDPIAVADKANNRVLLYGAPLMTGQSANVVLGQVNFTSNTAGATASTMLTPSAVAADKSGNLYVTEDQNCRLTQFKPPFSNGMSASLVFGQPNLNSGVCPSATSASSLGNTTTTISGDEVFGVSTDSSGDLWVTDDGSNRIVEYVPPFSNGMAATLAIGQPNLTSGSCLATPTSASLCDSGLAIFDPSGNLWVADFANSRLLEFIPPFSTGMAASLVLGQADFTHNLANEGGSVGANTLYVPNAVAFDSSGNMWLADPGDNRVLEFKPPFTTNMNASLVLGQSDFTHSFPNQGLAAPTSATLNSPYQVAFDEDGSLLVDDALNNRTLVFVPPFSNGMNASLVIGQANFTSAGASTTATGQSLPTGAVPLLY